MNWKKHSYVIQLHRNNIYYILHIEKIGGGVDKIRRDSLKIKSYAREHFSKFERAMTHIHSNTDLAVAFIV